MKRNASRLVSTLLVLCLTLALLPGSALAVETSGGLGRDLTWSYSGGTLTFEGTGAIRDFDSSRPPWDDYSENIRSIEIGNGVTAIGSGAFFYCSNLVSVTIPNSVTRIGDYTFDQCSSLRSVTIPNSVRSIGESAFADCRSLTSVTIPNGVTEIAPGMFARCENLSSVVIPNSVTAIGESAFVLCSALTGVDIPDSVTTIGKGAFNASGLTSVTIPDGVTAIGDDAFGGCPALTSVTIPDSVTGIGDSTFMFCSSLEKVNIPRGVTAIGDKTFFGCVALPAVDLPDGVTSIGSEAFMNCFGLTGMTIPESVASIGEAAFSGCYNMTSLSIPASVASIGESAFFSCGGLEDVYYGGSESQWIQISVGEYNEALFNAAVHYNSAGPEPSAPAPETIPATGTAHPSAQTVELDGKKAEFQMYALLDEAGDPTNYIRVRDLAMAMKGTKGQFNVDWIDGAVTLVAGAPYTTPNGSENTIPFSDARGYKLPENPTNVNGAAGGLTAFVLTDDEGGDHTYYQLRDLGKALGFNVGWSAERGVFIESDKPYTDAD